MSYLAAMQGTGTSRVYLGSDGNVDVFSGGTRAARNFNPGNLRYGTFAQSEGAIGRDKDGFAIFPDKETGTAAQESLLSQPRYQNLSIDQAIAKYAPPQENDTAGYQSAIRQALGLPGSTPMSSLSADQLDRMVAAMQQHEGYTDASMRNIMNIGDPLRNFKSDFDPNDPNPGDNEDNGVGTGQRGETSSPVPASFTSLDGESKSFEIGNNEIDLNGPRFNINATGENIDLNSNTHADISGSNNTIAFNGQNGFAGIQGTGETINNNDASNLVNINGNGSSATVNGDVSIGLYGSGQSVTLDNAGDHLTVYGGFTNEGVNASGDTVSLGANANGNVYGSGDTIQLQADSSAYVGVFGQNQTVTGDTGSSNVNLGGDGTSATVFGGGYVGLCGNNETLKVDTGEQFSIATAPGVTNDTIYAENSTINLAAGWSGNIYGEGLTINMSPNSGSDVTVYGYDDQVNGDHGDVLQADAYDPNDPNDPYAPYQPGDPAPGTPYNPGETDPTDPDPDPTDPDPWDDDELVAVKTVKSTHTAASGSTAQVTAHTQPATATVTHSTSPATGATPHIATQASQLASAMAAFGGTTSSDIGLHGTTPAAHTTLTVDSSQATHPLRHAA